MDDLIATTSHTPASRQLVEAANHQRELTSTFPRKLWQFVRTALLGAPNTLEQYLVATEPNDCSLVAKYKKVVDIDVSALSSISVDSITVSALHIPHPLVNFAKSNDLEHELGELPVVVFIHGLGGQMSNFEPLMALLSQCVEIVSLDLPGFGNSRARFDPRFKTETSFSDDEKLRISKSVQAMSWSDFSTDNIASILLEFVSQQVPPHKKVILVGHSMGTALSIKLTKKLPPHRVEGLIMLTPPPLVDDVTEGVTLPSTSTGSHWLRFFTYVPALFNWFRIWDRLPGLDSVSVLRQLSHADRDHPGSNVHVKARQLRWNADVDTRVVLRYVAGFSRAKYSELVAAINNFNDNPADRNVYEKTLVIGAGDDAMTPVDIVTRIEQFANSTFRRKNTAVVRVNNVGHSLLLSKPEFISGIILNHLEAKFPERLHLSPSWVLQVKAKISGDKWGLKNEMKWQALQPVSFNITRPNGEVAPLLAMKTLREDDPIHSPVLVEQKYAHGTGDGNNTRPDSVRGRLVAIVDISADIPPYKPTSFHDIKYYKCSTVSKVVPDLGAVRRFVQLVDDILSENVPDALVAVHCHYGFNRTGYLICCFLVERRGWTVQEAVEAFREAKLPGIKHPHFIDALYVRYEK